jgi:hypothetical protein
VICGATDAVARTLPHGSFWQNFSAGRWRDGGFWMSEAGIGVISRELAATSVASATIVEASPAYLEVARREAGSQYGSRPTQFILGDFAVIADTLPDADVVTLDRVVCCYPDAEALLQQAARRARQLLAFTYPRNRWYVRTLIVLENVWMRLTGKGFRAFVHAPERMGAVLEAAGLVRATRRETLVWTFDLYRRGRDV